MIDRALRVDLLRAHGATPDALDELLAYTENRFDAVAASEAVSVPLEDEPFVAAWAGYAGRAAEAGVSTCLRETFPQLHFPIERGISASEGYRAATLRGEWPPASGSAPGVVLRSPEELRLFLHPTAAGRIPVLVAGAREDFVTLVQAFTRRNEPDPLPDSMGACMVAGFNNWDRIRALRRAWEAENPTLAPHGWSAAFRAITPRKELYQDRFILLSRGAYSGVPAAAVGLDEAEWAELSLHLRLEHECAHYFTRRVLGGMKNLLHDELIADSVGLLAATGRFHAEWFLRFMGLEAFPVYRPGGRLENYRGDPPLSDPAFRVLQSLVVAAAITLETGSAASTAEVGSLAWRARWIRSLAARSLEELALPFSTSGPSDAVVVGDGGKGVAAEATV